MKAIERPEYLLKDPEFLFWEVQVEYIDAAGDRCVSFNIFKALRKAEAFARRENVPFSRRGYYAPLAAVNKRKATKHF